PAATGGQPGDQARPGGEHLATRRRI
ncbi:uncharacterized protein METZ01_LOCUS300084, partial [marine metagenome]